MNNYSELYTQFDIYCDTSCQLCGVRTRKRDRSSCFAQYLEQVQTQRIELMKHQATQARIDAEIDVKIGAE